MLRPSDWSGVTCGPDWLRASAVGAGVRSNRYHMCKEYRLAKHCYVISINRGTFSVLLGPHQHALARMLIRQLLETFKNHKYTTYSSVLSNNAEV